MPVDLSAPEIRVLGCLLEKQRTTPDAYPLSLNALRLACNQATNRDPVIEYDEAVVRDALHRLSRRRWTRLASGAGSRAPKYRHLLDEALGLPEDELAVLCVLMLRGAQTPGRAQAAHRAPARARRPLGGHRHAGAADRPRAGRAPAAPAGAEGGALRAICSTTRPGEPGRRRPPWRRRRLSHGRLSRPAPAAAARAGDPDPRVGRLEAEVAALRADLDALRATVDALRADLGA